MDERGNGEQREIEMWRAREAAVHRERETEKERERVQE